jgi:hypothetical protein
MRAITVKQGTAFFFPVINAEFDNIGCTPHLAGPGDCLTPRPAGVPALQAEAAAIIDAVSEHHSQLTPTNASFTTATGPTMPLSQPRLQSPPFKYTLPATDNLQQFFGFNVSGTVAPAAADGYYTFIPGTLAAGCYKLEFGGKCRSAPAGIALYP